MRVITEGLSNVATINPSVAKLHRLFSSFVNLCSTLVQNNHETSEAQSLLSSARGGVSADRAQVQLETRRFDEGNILNADLGQTQRGDFHGQEIFYQSVEPEWCNDLMSELFDSQPWLGWIECDNTTVPWPLN